MTKDSLSKGIIVLGSGMALTRLMGLGYRLILPNIIGSEAMGLYGIAYTVYSMLLTLSMAGIPVAISKLVSYELSIARPDYAIKIIKLTFFIVLFLGTFFSILLYLTSDFIAIQIIGDTRVSVGLKAISPAILLTGFISILRGYFQGCQKMKYTAYSQLIEQLFRVIGIIILATVLYNFGVEYAAAGAVFGNVVGTVGAVIYLVWVYFFVFELHQNSVVTSEQQVNPVYQNRGYRGFQKTDLGDSKKNNIINKLIESKILAKRIVLLTVPVIIGSAIMPITNLIDAVLVVNRLVEAGFSLKEATSNYAYLTQYAAPLIMFPTTIGIAFSTALVPAISENLANRHYTKIISRIDFVIKIVIIIGLPASTGLLVMANPVINLIFPGADQAVTPLRLLSPTVVFLILKHTTTGILQGLNHADIPVKTLLIGVLLKTAITYWFTAVPGINIKAAAVGTVLFYLVGSLINSWFVAKLCDIKLFSWKLIFKSMILSVLISGIAFLLQSLLTHFFIHQIATLLSIFVAIAVYIFGLIFTKTITVEELNLIPGIGSKLTDYIKNRY